MNTHHLIPLLTLLPLLWSQSANSKLYSSTMPIALSGTLVVATQCTAVSTGGEQQIVTDFGERLGVTRIDGVNYLQEVNYRIECTEGDNSGFDLKLSVVGTATPYDRAALSTSLPDLGIQLRQNGQPFELNQAITINPASPPVLQAVPVRRPGSTLPEGVFKATATLLAIYE